MRLTPTSSAWLEHMRMHEPSSEIWSRIHIHQAIGAALYTLACSLMAANALEQYGPTHGNVFVGSIIWQKETFAFFSFVDEIGVDSRHGQSRAKQKYGGLEPKCFFFLPEIEIIFSAAMLNANCEISCGRRASIVHATRYWIYQQRVSLEKKTAVLGWRVIRHHCDLAQEKTIESKNSNRNGKRGASNSWIQFSAVRVVSARLLKKVLQFHLAFLSYKMGAYLCASINATSALHGSALFCFHFFLIIFIFTEMVRTRQRHSGVHNQPTNYQAHKPSVAHRFNSHSTLSNWTDLWIFRFYKIRIYSHTEMLLFVKSPMNLGGQVEISWNLLQKSHNNELCKININSQLMW